MKRFAFPLTIGAVLAVTVSSGWLIGTWRQRGESPAPTSSVDRGPLLYQVHCAACHGADGHGDGVSALTLRPPPRDFGARPWRFEPTAEAIRKVVLDGIHGTGMPSFRTALSATDLEAIVAHVERLSRLGPANQSATDDAQLLTASGFTNLLGSTPPPLTLTDASGRTVRLKDYAGRLVILHFWGTSCTHCIKEIPSLQALEKQYAGQLVVLHICTDEDDPKVAQELLDKAVPKATSLVEVGGFGLKRFDVQVLPTVWLIAPDGTAIGRASGTKDWTTATQQQLLTRWLPKR